MRAMPYLMRLNLLEKLRCKKKVSVAFDRTSFLINLNVSHSVKSGKFFSVFFGILSKPKSWHLGDENG